LCAGLAIIIGEYNISLAIMRRDYYSPNRKSWWDGFDRLGAPAELAAAMSARRYHIVAYQLREFPDNGVSIVYGTPLINVFKLGDQHLLNIMVQHLDSPRLNQQSNIQRRNILFQSSQNNAFPVHKAMLCAISYNQLNMTTVLLQLYTKYIRCVEDSELNDWLEAAVDQGNVAMVHALAKMPCNSWFKIRFPLMGWICETGDYDLVSAAFRLTSLQLTHGSSAQNPLHIAVRSSYADSVRALVDTGRVKINALVSSNIPRYSRGSIITLDVAVYHGHVAVIQYLISQGAVLADKMPSKEVPGYIYKLLRQASIDRNNGKTFKVEYGQWKNLGREERNYMMGI
ncbi:uncharacterized protein K460DRAFT_290326, partial [Cucurbitaria berberidis CBS 394.84]